MFKSIIIFGCLFTVGIALEKCYEIMNFASSLDKINKDTFAETNEKTCSTKCVVRRMPSQPNIPFFFEFGCATAEDLKLCTDGFKDKKIPQTNPEQKYLDGVCCDFDFCNKFVQVVDGTLKMKPDAAAEATKEAAAKKLKEAEEAAKKKTEELEAEAKKLKEEAEAAAKKLKEDAEKLANGTGKKIEDGANEAADKAKETGDKIADAFKGKYTVVNVLMPVLCFVFFCF